MNEKTQLAIRPFHISHVHEWKIGFRCIQNEGEKVNDKNCTYNNLENLKSSLNNIFVGQTNAPH